MHAPFTPRRPMRRSLSKPSHTRQGDPLSCRRRRRVFEVLEDRRLLSLGDLLHTLYDPSSQAGASFAYAVAADGNWTVVGTPWADAGSQTDAGRAYVFDSTTGALVATLQNPTPAYADRFGISVAVSGRLRWRGRGGGVRL